jgi:opacity protein-like surface antigen
MRKKFLTLACTFLLAGTAVAQVTPSATGSHKSLSAGALFSYTQPNCCTYDTSNNPVVGSNGNHLYGIGVFVDYRMSRWLQLEGEYRKLPWNQYQDQNIRESSTLVGLREPIRTFGRVTPYGKALVGLGSASFLTGRAFAYALGGGADYRLNKRWSLRGDFEYQRWSVSPTALKPYVASAGLKYRIF